MLWIMHGYVAWRFIPALGFSSSQTILAYTAVFILSLLPILPIALRMSGNESKLIDKFSFVGYTSLGFFTLSFFIFVAKDLVLQLIALLGHIIDEDNPFDNSKRDFIKKSISISMITLAGSATVYGFYSARKGPFIIKHDIYIKNLPEAYENFSIAQISDLHVGPTIKRPYVEDVLEKISHLNPDFIAVTGDLVDGSVKYLRSDLQPLKDMIAPYGTFFVTGNHEYYSGVDQWLDETDRLGMKNLINTNEIISKSGDEIAIAGITDLNAHQINLSHRSDPELALASLPKDIIKIVLAHQPNSIHAVHKVGADLQLSGHTHGGQFWPFTYPVKLASTYIAGYYDHFGTQIYVNRGTGYWGPPLRIGVPAEITLIRLKKKVVS
ncbi:MAG: metallophosphoesterase [Candidatus Neomarinimicrobiota bacterium]|nr:metallophosphoesterase [Candidatus Neomarinimicrobiota bacterium]